MEPIIALPLRLDGAEPLYRQVYHGLRDAIVAGRLGVGDRLPSSRELADRLSVSRNVVLLAYAQLEAEGYVMGQVGSGTYVRHDLPDQSPGGLATAILPDGGTSGIGLSAFGRRLAAQGSRWPDESSRSARWDFTVGRLARSDFPVREWQRAMRWAAGRSELEYGPAEGHEALRRQILRHVQISRGVVADVEQVMITTGMRQGYDLTLRMLVDPADRVVVEDPGFPPVALWTAAYGAEPVRAVVDAEGVIAGALAGIGAARLAYLTPSHQYPTGAILSLARRFAVLEWAKSAGCLLFEDDYDAEFQYAVRPIPALQGLAPESVIYAGSMAKTLSPGLRLGYLIVPGELVDAFRAAKRGADRETSSTLQHVLASFMAEGAYARHLRRQRMRYRKRREALLSALERVFGERVAVRGVEAGLQLLVCFPDVPALLEPELVKRAAEVGVRVEGAAICYASPPEHASLLFGFAATSEPEILEGIRRIELAVAQISR